MITQSPSKEQLIADIAHAEEKAKSLCGPCADDHERLAYWLRALLASYDQDPVAWTSQRSLDVRDKITAFTSEESAIDYGKSAAWETIVALYAHASPSIPAVLKKCPTEIRDLIASHSDELFDDDDAQEIWNACLAAMLNGGKS